MISANVRACMDSVFEGENLPSSGCKRIWLLNTRGGLCSPTYDLFVQFDFGFEFVVTHGSTYFVLRKAGSYPVFEYVIVCRSYNESDIRNSSYAQLRKAETN